MPEEQRYRYWRTLHQPRALLLLRHREIDKSHNDSLTLFFFVELKRPLNASFPRLALSLARTRFRACFSMEYYTLWAALIGIMRHFPIDTAQSLNVNWKLTDPVYTPWLSVSTTSKAVLKTWFHGRNFSAKCEIFYLLVLNCEQSSRNNVFEIMYCNMKFFLPPILHD